MAWKQSLFDRIMPAGSGEAAYSDEDKRALLNQGLLGLASGLLGTPGGIGAGLAQGIQGGLLGMNKSADDLSDRAYRKQYLKGQLGAPTEVRTLQMLKEAGKLTEDEFNKAVRVNLGLEGRASNAGFGFEMLEGADGRKRPARQDPRTGQTWIFDENVGGYVPYGGPPVQQNPMSSGPTQGGGHFSNFQAIDESTGQPITDPAELAAIQASIPQMQQRVAAPNPNLLVGRPKEDEAGRVAAAQEAAKLAYLPQAEAIRANAGIQQALATAQGQADISLNKDRTQGQHEKDQALRVYDEAMKGLTSGLDASATGPIVGRLPALTSGQQMAEGGVAAMAPVLKQLFRTAGEGTFTDKDQQLLISMLPTRTDTPEARQFKMGNIDSIVRAKLSASPSPRRPMVPKARKTMERKPQVLRYNPATGKLE